MASASSSAARSLIRDGKSVASLLFRARAANLTATNTGPAIRSMLRFNQTPASQYPVFSETFQAMQVRVGLVQQEVVSERIEKVEAAQGKRVVNKESSDSEEEPYFDDEEDFDDDVDVDDDEEIDDVDEDDDDDEEEEEEEEEDKTIRKKK